MFDKLTDKKDESVCGHLNPDLLNVNHHKSTTDFIDTIYSHNLFPVIIKPSKITTNTAALINNIFTYKFGSNIVGGLLPNYKSVHFAVFAIFQDFNNYLL